MRPTRQHQDGQPIYLQQPRPGTHPPPAGPGDAVRRGGDRLRPLARRPIA